MLPQDGNLIPFIHVPIKLAHMCTFEEKKDCFSETFVWTCCNFFPGIFQLLKLYCSHHVAQLAPPDGANKIQKTKWEIHI